MKVIGGVSHFLFADTLVRTMDENVGKFAEYGLLDIKRS